MIDPLKGPVMIDDMGIFRTDIEIAAWHHAGKKHKLTNVMVDTGSEYNWIPADILRDLDVTPERIDRFETADGRILEREIGFALFFAANRSSPAIAVFAQPGDMILLGAHALEGMNLRVDPVRRELVPAGPVPAAAMRSPHWTHHDVVQVTAHMEPVNTALQRTL